MTKVKFFSTLRNGVLNSIYFSAVFLAALAFASLAMARQVNSLESRKEPLILNIAKEKITITNAVPGRLTSVDVRSGVHVKEGDSIAVLNDETYEAKIKSLDSVAGENISAKTEASLLRAQSSLYEIRAPRAGVIYSVDAGEGAYLSMNSNIVTIFADTNVKLVGYANTEEYAELQNGKEIYAYSPRFEQIYSLTMEGVGRVIPATQYEPSSYELQFRFTNPDEGAAFIQGEGLQLVQKAQASEILRPAFVVTKFWNNFIIGKSS